MLQVFTFERYRNSLMEAQEGDTYNSGLYYKSFRIVIYDHNGSIQYYETMILANRALARSVNYDHKVRWKLKHTLQ